MAIKDQIPSFPTLVSAYSTRNFLAHGSEDFHEISRKYYSTPEREHAEELAHEKIFDLLRSGRIRATGRASDARQGTSARWEAQRYKNHSKIREYIDTSFWTEAIFAKSSHLNTARDQNKEYTDIMLVFDDCRDQLAEDIAVHRKEKSEAIEADDTASDYSTPYIEIMWKAIDHFNISAENQPIKDTLVEWFLEQEIAGQKLSQATASYLASFVRLPESRMGGNRPWKVKAQKEVKTL